MARPLSDAPFFDPAVFAPEDGSGTDVPCRHGFDALRQGVAALRAESPILRSEMGVTVVGQAAVHRALGDKRLRSGIPDIVALQGADGAPIGAGLANSVLASEGERHIRLRRMCTKALTPRAVEAHRPAIVELATALVESLDRDHCEFMADFADRLPVQVICHVLGVPEADRERFAEWNHAITWMLSDQLSERMSEIEWGLGSLLDYVGGLIDERRRSPGDDLVSRLIIAHLDDGGLEAGDVAHMVTALLFAGHDTTRNQLGLGMWFFAHDPDQWARLRAEPTFVERAVEEVLRFRGTAGTVPRVATEDLELGGYLIPAGTFVALSLNHANNDPDVYDDPLVFDITKEREAVNSFGGGSHYCLGVNLARAELQEAFRAMAEAFEVVELAGEAIWRPPIGIFGPATLPLRFVAT